MKRHRHTALPRPAACSPWAWMVAAALWGAAGCGVPEVSHPVWDPIDVQAATLTLEQPTARVCGPELQQVESWFEYVLPWMVEQYRTMERVIDTIRNAPSQPPPDGGSATSPTPPTYDPTARSGGTTVYLDFACPGPKPSEPVRDFTAGWVRFDSPWIDRDSGAIVSDGNVRLTWQTCRMPFGTLEGQMPGMLDVDAWELLLQGEIAYAPVIQSSRGTPSDVDAVTRFRTGTAEASMAINDGGSVTFVVTFDDVVGGAIKAANGTLGCAVQLEPTINVACEVPGDC
jgi:hypothetical protein